MNPNRFIVQVNTCTVHVQWITDPSETGARARAQWHNSHTVTFENGSDLLEKLQKWIPAKTWLEVYMSAQDMAPQFPDAVLNEHGDPIDEELENRRFRWTFITSDRRVYTDTGDLTLTAFPRLVDQYCNDCVALKRRLLRLNVSKSVPVALDLHVLEREPDTWEEPVNLDGNQLLANKRLGRK
jgi:hypothetical protein